MSRIKQKPTEYVEKIDNSISIKISTNTLEDIPEVVYIRVKLRINPLVKKKTYDEDIIWIKNRFEDYAKNIFNNLSYYNNEQYLFNVSVSSKSVKYGKNTHFHYDVFLKPLLQEDMNIHIERLKKLIYKLNQKLNKLLLKQNISV